MSIDLIKKTAIQVGMRVFVIGYSHEIYYIADHNDIHIYTRNELKKAYSLREGELNVINRILTNI